jgi:hypothetical protein
MVGNNLYLVLAMAIDCDEGPKNFGLPRSDAMDLTD